MFVIPISAGSVFWSYFSVMTASGTFELCNLIKSAGVSPVDIIPLRIEPDPIPDSRLPQRGNGWNDYCWRHLYRGLQEYGKNFSE